MSSFDDEKKGSANVSVLPDSEVLPEELRHDDLVIDPVEEKSECMAPALLTTRTQAQARLYYPRTLHSLHRVKY